MESGFNQEVAIILSIQSSDSTPKQQAVIFFQLKGMKEYLLLCPSFADPKGHHMSFIKSYNENTIQASIYNALFLETPKIYLTQPLSLCYSQNMAVLFRD